MDPEVCVDCYVDNELPALPEIPPEVCLECYVDNELPELPNVIPPAPPIDPEAPVDPEPCIECGTEKPPTEPEFPLEPPIGYSVDGKVCGMDTTKFDIDGFIGLYSAEHEGIYNHCTSTDGGNDYHAVIYDENIDTVLVGYSSDYIRTIGGISRHWTHITYYGTEGSQNILAVLQWANDLTPYFFVRDGNGGWNRHRVLNGEIQEEPMDKVAPQGDVPKHEEAITGMEEMLSQFVPNQD